MRYMKFVSAHTQLEAVCVCAETNSWKLCVCRNKQLEAAAETNSCRNSWKLCVCRNKFHEAVAAVCECAECAAAVSMQKQEAAAVCESA